VKITKEACGSVKVNENKAHDVDNDVWKRRKLAPNRVSDTHLQHPYESFRGKVAMFGTPSFSNWDRRFFPCFEVSVFSQEFVAFTSYSYSTVCSTYNGGRDDIIQISTMAPHGICRASRI